MSQAAGLTLDLDQSDCALFAKRLLLEAEKRLGFRPQSDSRDEAAAMKITINIDCTPDEARSFMGLPDLRPMQEALLKEIQARMIANIQAMAPAELMKAWFPASIEGLKQWQDMFLNQTGAKK
jgi:hypothetical protein